MIKLKLKYFLGIGILSSTLMSCGGSSVGNDGYVSLGKLSTGQDVMVSSGNIPVNAAKTGSQVGALRVNGLAANQHVTLILPNELKIPRLRFATQNLSGNKSNEVSEDTSRCTVTAQSSSCILIAETNGAYNGNYAMNLDYQMTNPNETGVLDPIEYTVTGGVPKPTPVLGSINMSVSADSLNVNGAIIATYTLIGASNLDDDVVVTASSSNTSVLKAYNDVNECKLNLETPTCTVTEYGVSAGTAVISSVANGYTIANSNKITVNPEPLPVVAGTISMNLSAESINVGGSIVATYTLIGSQNITIPVNIVATSLVPDVLVANDTTCQVTTANPTCTITELGINGGVTKISSQASNYTIADSSTINVISHAYVTNYHESQITKCVVSNVDGSLSNCNTALSDISYPSFIIFNNGYAYVARQDANNTVTKYSVDQNGNLINGVVTNGFSKTTDTIAINNMFMYVGGMGSPLISQCIIGDVGSLTNCLLNNNQLGIGILGIAFHNNNVYMTSMLNTTPINIVQKCMVNPINGSFSNCTKIKEYKPYDMIRGITIDRNFAYIDDDDDNQIEKCPILENGDFGECVVAASISHPRKIAINRDMLYVTSLVNNSVTKCNLAVEDGSLNNCTLTGGSFPSAMSIAIH